MARMLSEALDALDERAAEAQKAAETLVRMLKQLRQAAKQGHVGDIGKRLAALPERGADADRAARQLGDAWRFDASGYLAAGYRDELREAAEEAGIRLIERDGRLYAFPIMIRLEPAEAAVKVGRKRERGIRPARLAAQIAALQKKPPSSPARFLELLYKAYQRMAGRDWRSTAPVIPVAEIHAMLTLLPGADYPIEEFGRDLLLLDRQPDLRTNDGSTFAFIGSTLAKERGVQRISTYDEEGNERTFIGIRFAAREP